METIRLEHDGDVLVATIDHPDSAVNAVDGRLHHDLGELFRTLKTESAGAGRRPHRRRPGVLGRRRHGVVPDAAHDRARPALRREAKQIIWDLLDVELPIVCGLNGSAAGLAASVALLCDVVVMAEAAVDRRPARQGRPRRRRRRGGDLAAAARSARRQAHLMLGDPLTAADALRLGVAAEVCPAPDVGARAMAWARRLADGAPLAVQGTKHAVNAQIKQALLTSFDVSMALEMPCILSADHAEAVDAFVEGRQPTFHGR